MKSAILFPLILTLSTSCFADSKLAKSEFTESAFDIKNNDSENSWDMAAEVGATLTSGNTETQSFKGKLEGGLDYLGGRLSYLAQFYQKSVEQEKNADKWKVGLKHNLHLGEHSSTFSIFEYARDKFASATQTVTFAAGYTQRILDNEAMLWNADIGPGVVRTTMEAGEENRKIIHLGSQFKFKLNETTEFEQSVVADLNLDGNDYDVYRSETSLSASVVENLKMKLAYAAKFDADVEIGKEKLDTETSVSLVYIF